MYICPNNCAVEAFLFHPEYLQELETYSSLISSTIPVNDIASGIAVAFLDGAVTARWGNRREGVPANVRREAQTFVDSRVPGIVVCPVCAENARWRRRDTTLVPS